jgi:hypothetical protein
LISIMLQDYSFMKQIISSRLSNMETLNMLNRNFKILKSGSALTMAAVLGFLAVPAHAAEPYAQTAMTQAQKFEAQMMEQTSSPLQIVEQTLKKEAQDAAFGQAVSVAGMEDLPGMSAPSVSPTLAADQVSAMLDQPETVARASADKTAEMIRAEVKREMTAEAVANIAPAAGDATAAVETVAQAQRSVNAAAQQAQEQVQQKAQEMSSAAEMISAIEPSAGTMGAGTVVAQAAPAPSAAPMSLRPEVEALPQFTSGSSEILKKMMQDDAGMNYYTNNPNIERKVLRGASATSRRVTPAAPVSAQTIARGNATRLRPDQALNNITPAAGGAVSAPNQMNAITVEQSGGAKTTIRSNLDTGVVIE